ncbi:hypothetical protein Z948_3156 [Sulfitobacter donghicola DSW-25 = KCTC 12864 = JCM 14565]|uniref:Sulfotransferase domain-containing protein n=2 Tax=Sulfitobacter TaxID=60136 RepID=A0A073IH62_9RHOB|nr:hypothetical protein DSW25_11345 [Sulfitobacter donghicola DSW-25 = KCTC 12864 = JCM 14565]KIN69415.1 hypothetical protein Z948_3156 [Sulfitobacter donghicola DSW-25 = KCTC 12864 = JCM 14565]
MLAENRDLLANEGYDIAYPGRDDIPQGDLRLRLPHPRNLAKWESGFLPGATKELQRFATPDSHAMILSEENIPGRMIHFPTGQFYPAAEVRLQTLAAAAQAPVLRAVLVVRDYVGLYVSAYRKRAEDNVSPPFAEGRHNMLHMDRGWPELVRLVFKHLKVQELVVIDYARRGRSVDILGMLVPELAGVPLREPARRMNHSATDAALIELQSRYQKGEVLQRQEWQKIIADNREDKKPRGVSEFTKRQTRILEGRYQEHLDEIAQMPAVMLLR